MTGWPMMRILPSAVVPVAGVLLLTASLIAQGAFERFDVASVKGDKSGSNRVVFAPEPGGRFSAVNASVTDMIRMSYGSDGQPLRARITNAPNWLSTDRFDIVAKVTGEPAITDVQRMMRALLAERFKLAIHAEAQEASIYRLVLARADGRLGPNLKPAALDCSAPSPTCRMDNAPGQLVATALPIDALARLLTGWLEDHRDVRNETGLAGNFSMTLEWAFSRPLRDRDGTLIPVDPNKASLFTALSEQLGLKLESAKDQTDFLVIDHVEHPAEN